MDELWQRYRTFWTPVLIGLGIFLVGVIAVHVISEDPEVEASRMEAAEGRLAKMKQPDARTSSVLKGRAEAFQANVLGGATAAAATWATRLNQTGTTYDDVISAGAEQALRASILRGAPEEVARNAKTLAGYFEDDEVAADKAYKRFQRTLEQQRETLRTGDANVAWAALLQDVWADLRIRANRADVELSPIADQLGFASISSVSSATLPARVLNLALTARVADIAIREGVESIDSIQIATNVDPGSPDDFMVLWPVEIVLTGEIGTIRHIMDMLTVPTSPVPLEYARLMQPKAGGSDGSRGLIQFSMKASSVVIRPQADLKLDAEEE